MSGKKLLMKHARETSTEFAFTFYLLEEPTSQVKNEK